MAADHRREKVMIMEDIIEGDNNMQLQEINVNQGGQTLGGGHAECILAHIVACGAFASSDLVTGVGAAGAGGGGGRGNLVVPGS